MKKMKRFVLVPQQELIQHRFGHKFRSGDDSWQNDAEQSEQMAMDYYAQHQDKLQKTESTPHYSTPGSVGDESSSPELESERTTETNRRPSLSQKPLPGPSLISPPSSSTERESRRPSRINRHNHVKPLPLDEMSEPWQSPDIGRKDGSTEDDLATVLNRTHDRLRRAIVKFQIGSDYDYPLTPAGVEMAVRDLTRVFGELNKALRTNGHNYDSLKVTSDQLTTENTELKEKMSKMKVALEKDHSERAKRMLQHHQSEKIFMVENHKLEKERLENAIVLLEKKQKEKEVLVDNFVNDEFIRMKTECDNQIYQSQNSLRLTKEHYENLLKTQQHQHEEEKHHNYYSLTVTSDQLTTENTELKEKMSKMKVALEKDHSKRAKRTLQHHQSEKMFMVENHKLEKERLENAIILLEKKQKEKEVLVDNSVNEELIRMKTE